MPPSPYGAGTGGTLQRGQLVAAGQPQPLPALPTSLHQISAPTLSSSVQQDLSTSFGSSATAPVGQLPKEGSMHDNGLITTRPLDAAGASQLSCISAGNGGLEGFSGLNVPVEYVNAKVWGITSEYEKLLNIQRDQNVAAIKHKDAEGVHLRTVIDMLEKDKFDESSLAARIRAKEDEVGLALQAKNKELELFTSLLQMRDKQIGDLQQICQTKQAQIHKASMQAHINLLSQSVHGVEQPSICHGIPSSCTQAEDVRILAQERECQMQSEITSLHEAELSSRDALAEALREAGELRQEKVELEQLLVAKEKQLVRVQTAIDPSMSDTSALQLGVQAIQMFHDSMRIRSETAGRSEENEKLRVEADRMRAEIEELGSNIVEKRQEAKELAAALAAKLQKVLELETEVEELQREKRFVSKESAAQVERLQVELSQAQDNGISKQQFVADLQEALAERDHRCLQQQSECMQSRATSRRLEQKVEEMVGQLKNAEEALAQMLSESGYKDQLVREMTEQVNASETRLHAYQVSEVLGSRQRQLEQRARNSGMDHSMQEKGALDDQLRCELADIRRRAEAGRRRLAPAHPREEELGRLHGNCSAAGDTIAGGSGTAVGSRSGVGGVVPILSQGNSFDLSVDSPSLVDKSGATTPGVSLVSPRGMNVSGACVTPAADSYCSQAVMNGSNLQVVHGRLAPPSPASLGRSEGRSAEHIDVRVVNVFRAGDANSSVDPLLPTPTNQEVTVAAQGLAAAACRSGCGAVPFIAAIDGGSGGPAGGYRPQPGDLVDMKVAEFVNRPANSEYKALFCRLGEGAYLYGTHRARFRVANGLGGLDELEAFEDGTWIPISDFVKRLESSQLVHLRRARDHVGDDGVLR